MLSGTWILAVNLCLQNPPPPPPAVRWPDARPLTHVAQNLARDARALPSLSSLAIVAAGGLGAFTVHPADEELARWAEASGHSGYTEMGRTLGDGWVQGTAALTTYAIGRLAGHAEVTHLGSDLIRVQALNGALTTSLKYGINRARPNGGRLAFPSGHTSASFASAAVLHEHYGWKVGLAAYGAASFVGWTRVRDQKHWLSDVIFGGTIGMLAGRAVVSDHRTSRWHVTPSASATRLSLVVTRR